MPACERLVAVLADEERLALFARVVAAGPEGVAPGSLDARTQKALGRLIAAGAARRADDGSGRVTAGAAPFREAANEARAAAEAANAAVLEGAPIDVARCFSRGRLDTLPLAEPLRARVVAHVVERCLGDESGKQWTEAEVGERLAVVTDDVVTLRRELVDRGLLERSRDGSAYWRAG
ncbi:hypothetical protein BIV57_06650 [Mangrovactinospora gilvigrisea]|uniref:DUF2087 domain-containing protein n=1 Tax=Mangrovactinospora gilvigrisea TaxID=1428644 RepID=A0A1J7BI63_9ACTN|nr:hypothetical protein BIV57_06650 [Mangrovactinospora gilvigrisea]